MICQNCNTETNGVKLNGKLYCTQCGTILPSLKIETKASTPTIEEDIPKIIPADSEQVEKEIDKLGAELRALDILEHSSAEREVEENTDQELNKLKAAEELLGELEKTNTKNDTKDQAVPTDAVGTNILKSNRDRVKRPVQKEHLYKNGS